jgi:pimeloyl-ACP methyl ester carboxylesterase
MRASFILAKAAFVSSASAMTCVNITVPVDLSARNGIFDIEAPQNSIDVVNFILEITRQGTNYTEELLQGYKTVSGHYELAATYCVPGKNDTGHSYSPDTVQVLTHGLGFDRSYWDLPFNSGNYSYSAVATDDYGYATFSWDRLGLGMSSHGDPIQEVQALLEVDGLRALTEGLRNGCIDGIFDKFEKIVHVGHSFGSTHVSERYFEVWREQVLTFSVQTYALTAMYPNISDGIALSGFSQNGSFVPRFQLGGDFVDVKDNEALAPLYGHGYLAPGSPSAVQTNFFAPGAFDPEILTFVVDSGQPVTVGELLTVSGETASPNNFAGPVFVITGELDIPFCGGSCLEGAPNGSSIPAQAQRSFKSTNISTTVVPGAGHGLNLEYSHPVTYKAINDFFVQNLGQAAKASR